MTNLRVEMMNTRIHLECVIIYIQIHVSDIRSIPHCIAKITHIIA